jgi:hypothetical protein
MNPPSNLTPQHHHLVPKRDVSASSRLFDLNGKIKMETRQTNTNIVH